MRTSLVRRGAVAAAVATVLGLATAYTADATTDAATARAAAPAGTYLLMVKPPKPADTKHQIRGVELYRVPPQGTESGGHAKKLSGCIPLAKYPEYTNTHLHVRRGDAIEAQLFSKCEAGKGRGNMGGTVLWGATSKNIKQHKIFFDLGQ
ncbi:hypothetical protein [Streptomyces sp. Go-475]|uniref:hypothetical protein n=1 Tax=Streptomyces sp. Go-475 TaxID=2072505 RepID=UPI000DEFC389|nr:hypothetical protein [Streptomyces sp. Go-475]AXE87646.1 hypothetical protein C1703_21845 [Streptomyces sp. Go-475]